MRHIGEERRVPPRCSGRAVRRSFEVSDDPQPRQMWQYREAHGPTACDPRTAALHQSTDHESDGDAPNCALIMKTEETTNG